MAQNSGIIWKRRPSEIRGYQRTLYATDENGDYVRVDYHLKDKKARLYVELQDEGGAAYYSVIQNGSIVAERSVQSGRVGKFSTKFSDHAHIFSTIPNKEILDLINKKYGISQHGAGSHSQKDAMLQETRAKYFKTSTTSPYGTYSREQDINIIRGFSLLDALDSLVVSLLALGAYFLSGHTYVISGIILAVGGLILGVVDMVLREREPVLIKVILFFVAGACLYGYGYYIY